MNATVGANILHSTLVRRGRRGYIIPYFRVSLSDISCPKASRTISFSVPLQCVTIGIAAFAQPFRESSPGLRGLAPGFWHNVCPSSISLAPRLHPVRKIFRIGPQGSWVSSRFRARDRSWPWRMMPRCMSSCAIFRTNSPLGSVRKEGGGLERKVK